MTAPRKNQGLTLLEITLTLALMATIFSMVWGLMTLYSRHYLMGEKRMARAQLVRSISQMLDNDLSSAVQDPIHPTRPETSEAVSIRRFGLRGDSVSLAIDVVEPNLFAETATPAENLAFAVGGGKPRSPQVPELKTIFYEFVPINARDTSNDPPADSPGGGGSALIGTLQTPTPEGDTLAQTGVADVRPFVRKFGLSRRELDFETPDENNAAVSDKAGGGAGSEVIGSLSEPPRSSFAISQDENGRLLDGLAEATDTFLRPSLTAPQIALEIEDGSMWAPEVVNCRFRYFDGQDWFDTWNSLERSGLPVAIEVTMELMTLDDVEELRKSVYRPRLTLEPVAEAPREESALIGTLATEQTSANSLFAGSDTISLDNAVALLGLTPVMTRRVVSYLPTTPLAQHKIDERRRPIPTTAGNVSRTPTGGSGARKNQAEADRFVPNQTVDERRATDRQATERLAGERTEQRRASSNRQPLESRVIERTSAPPKAPPRSEERRTVDTPKETKRQAPQRVERSRTVREEPAAIDDPYAGSSAGPAFDPLFIGVEEPQKGPEPFARSDAAFDTIDSLMGGFEPVISGGVAGRVPASQGTALPTATSRSAAEKPRTSQTWIRGGGNR